MKRALLAAALGAALAFVGAPASADSPGVCYFVPIPAQSGKQPALSACDSNGRLLTAPVYPGTIATGAITGTAGTSTAASLAAPGAGVTNYITGFEVTSQPSAAIASGTVTIGGVGTALVYQYTETTNGSSLIVELASPIASSAANTAISVTVSAIASGSISSVVVHGFKL